jgi:hypothetical protein
MIINERGQALLEFFVVFIPALASVSGLLILLQIITIQVISKRIIYEELVCEQMLPHLINCKWQAQKKLKGIKMGSELIYYSINQSSHSVEAKTEFALPLHYLLKVEDSLELPLNFKANKEGQ